MNDDFKINPGQTLNLSREELDEIRKNYEEITNNVKRWDYPYTGGYLPNTGGTSAVPDGLTDRYRGEEINRLERRVEELENVVNELTKVLKFFKPFLSEEE